MPQSWVLGRSGSSRVWALVLGGSLGVLSHAHADEPGAVPPPAATAPAPAAPAAEAPSAPQPASPAETPSPAAPAESAPAANPPPVAPTHAAEHRVAHHHPHPREVAAQGRRGFVVSAALGIRPVAFPQSQGGSISTAVALAMQGGLAVGFKTGRVTVTLGLDLTALDRKTTFAYATAAAFLVVPGLQVALLRSRDHRVELLGSVRFGVGAAMASDSASTDRPPTLIMYELGPAMRFWAHKQFAVQFLAGYSGEYALLKTSTTSTVSGLHGLAASLGAVGLF